MTPYCTAPRRSYEKTYHRHLRRNRLLIGAVFGADPIARSQLRRTVDPSERSATGSILLRQHHNQQIFEATITGLGEESFGLFTGPKSNFSTGCCIYAVAPLDRSNVKKGKWSRRLVGIDGAPAELVNLGVDNLQDLAGSEAEISSPKVNNLIQGITNVVGNVTNIIVGIQVPAGNITNEVASSLWAPLYPLSLDPNANSYLRKTTILPPVGTPAPSPGAKAKLTVRFKGGLGRSTFDISASKLTRGQVYHAWIANSTNQVDFILIDAGTLTSSKNASTFRYTRDTRYGDPLPQQARDSGDLSGRVIQIRDEFGRFIHLEGVIP